MHGLGRAEQRAWHRVQGHVWCNGPARSHAPWWRLRGQASVDVPVIAGSFVLLKVSSSRIEIKYVTVLGASGKEDLGF